MKGILKAIRPQKSLKELNWLDVFVLTAILFGNAIYTLTMLFIPRPCNGLHLYLRQK